MEKPTHKILTNVFYVYNSNFFTDEAVPEYELVEAGIYPDKLGSFHGFLYMEKGELGWFEDNRFENEEGCGSRMEEQFVEKI